MSLNIRSKSQYKEFYDESLNETEAYWNKRAESFEWFKKWDSVCTGSLKETNIRWFDGAQLNITVNALDRHAKASPNKRAIIWEPNDPSEQNKIFTYQELLWEVNKFANVLKDLNVKKVTVYVYTCPWYLSYYLVFLHAPG